jgi:hypothetical protein
VRARKEKAAGARLHPQCACIREIAGDAAFLRFGRIWLWSIPQFTHRPKITSAFTVALRSGRVHENHQIGAKSAPRWNVATGTNSHDYLLKQSRSAAAHTENNELARSSITLCRKALHAARHAT